jgi:hypothetical protein
MLVAVSGCLAWPGAALGAATVPPAGEPVEFGAWTGVRHRIVGDPDWLAADDSHVYVRAAEYVHVLDPESGAITTTVDIAMDLCQGIGAGLGAVWSCSGSDLIRIDPDAGEVDTSIPVNKSAQHGHLATGFDRLWVLTGDGSTLAAVDPEAGEIVGEITLDARCLDVRVDETSVWVACALDDVVLRGHPRVGGRRLGACRDEPGIRWRRRFTTASPLHD